MKNGSKSVVVKKALFLDRDGVINFDPDDYTKSLSEFQVLPGVIETLKQWFNAGYILIIVTNQGGLAKGRYTKDVVHAIHQYFQGLCIQSGFVIAHFYFCSHHIDSFRCLCRKPGSLMIEKGLHHFNLDASECILIGDRQRDIDAAISAGVRGILIERNSRIPKPEEVC